MGFVTKAEAFIISEIKSKAMDRINMGGSFLQQSKAVNIGGLAVATRLGGGLGTVGGALGAVVSAVQQAGDIASLVQNPMSLVQGAVGDAISGVTGKLGVIAGQLSGGQLSGLTSSLSNISTALSDFQAHTSNLSGLSSSITDTIPDFKKLQSVGESLRGLGTEDTASFISNTATALKSQTELTEIKDKLEVIVQSKMDLILQQDASTTEGQTAISLLVSDIGTLLNNQTSLINDIVTVDTDKFNEASNTLTASQDVVGLTEQYSDTNSVTYNMFVSLGIAKPTTLSAFDTAIQTSEAQQE